GSGGATRGAARHQVAVAVVGAPRVDHRAVVGGLVGRAHGELVHVEFAEHHGAVVPQVGGDRRLVGRLEAVEDVAASLGVDALGGEQVLHADRHAFQRTGLALGDAFIGSPGHLAGLVGRDGDIGIDLAIRLLDLGEI